MVKNAVSVPAQGTRKRRRRIRPGCLTVYILLFSGALFAGYRFASGLFVPSVPQEPQTSAVSVADLPDALQVTLPESLKELLEKNPETADFVQGYDPSRKPAGDIDVSGDYTKGEIPLFLQWDSRWGYDRYGTDMMAITGCGPTCLSMIYVGLTGDTSMHPLAVAGFADKNGYYAAGHGSTWSLMKEGAEELGLSSCELPLMDSRIISELRDGHPVVCAVGAGDFTTEGHFIVLTGVDSDGKITLHDPNSKIRSAEVWSLDTLTKQIKNLWAISA